MAWTQVGSFMLVWWNTSLSPPIAKRVSTPDDLTFVADQIRGIKAETDFAAMALAEVSTGDLTEIMGCLGLTHLKLHDATDRDSQPMSDTAVIYDCRQVELVGSKRIRDSYSNHTLKTGESVIFRAIATGQYFRLVFSHWPSRRTYDDLHPVRAHLGMALRRMFDNPLDDVSTPYTIFMGDYNDEPFSSSLKDHLLATRDRSLARRKKNLLYNPFWRRIGESATDRDEDDDGFCGTHYYASGSESKWFTFDQIIFSPEFLQGRSMTLREHLCGILGPKVLRDKLVDRKTIFDHLPVFSTIDLRIET